MMAIGAYPTANKKGFSFSKLDEGVKRWISSLPDSKNPLLDLGSGHGFQTLAAIKAGRRVISVDCSEKNLETLRLYVNSELETEKINSEIGVLVDSVLATLPAKHLFAGESASGILLSEVIHFLPHQQVLPLFTHALHWLEKGGLFVVSTASPAFYRPSMKVLNQPICEEELSKKWKFVKHATDEELISKPVFAVEIGKGEGRKVVSEPSLQMRSTDELLVLAQLSGFEVLFLDYTSPGKYPFGSRCDDMSLLVAKKPE